MRLQDKSAIVTGAASGMGAATARLFAQEGAKVLLTDVLEDEGKAVAAEITAAGGTAAFATHDIAEESPMADDRPNGARHVRAHRHPDQQRRRLGLQP